MSNFELPTVLPASFTGKVRIFPLPNLVLFPNVMQPLRIFEPRYRALFEDALAGDKLIAMALLAPGWERDYDGRPPIYPVACLGKIATYNRLEDGTYNLLLWGMRRVRLLQEHDAARPFREATVKVYEEIAPPTDAVTQADLQRKLQKAFLNVLPRMPEAHEQFEQLVGNDLPLSVFTDTIAYLLDIGLEAKATLLGEPNVVRRAQILLKHLHAASLDDSLSPLSCQCFPPRFSLN